MATLAELERALTDLPDDTYRVGAARARPATEVEVAALEQALGWPLPAELRALYLGWGVVSVEVVEAVWPRPQEHDVLPAWRFEPGVVVLGVGAAVPPALAALPARTDAMVARGELPWLRRIGTGLTCVLTPGGTAACGPGDDRAPWDGDPIEIILGELRQLAEGVARLRMLAEPATALVARGAAAAWTGPVATDVLTALLARPADELVPVMPALRGALAGATHVMGALDVIAVAGPAGFAAVADDVYALVGGGDAAWVLELLGKIGATDPRAIAAYRAGLADDDGDVVEHALTAIGAVAGAAPVRDLADAVRAVAEDHDDDDRRFQAIGELGRLGAPGFEAVVDAALDGTADDAFATLVGALRGLALVDSPLAARLLARGRAIAPGSSSALAAIEALLAIGLRDPERMAPIARGFVARGGRWATRAEAVLAQL